MPNLRCKSFLLCWLASVALHAADVREHTRLTPRPATAVTRSQAVDLTLTLGETSMRPIQTWVRTTGMSGDDGSRVTAYLYPPDADLVKIGQRVRAFAMSARSSMHQARVTRVTRDPGEPERSVVEVTLANAGHERRSSLLLEIIADRGEFLSIPNEAIIEEQDHHRVYLEGADGDFVPREIQVGMQGELYTRVLSGLVAGDRVVTIGSFFVDAEYKMKSQN